MARVWMALLAVTVGILPQPAARAADSSVPAWLRGELGLSATVDVSSGDYGYPASTDILYLYVPFSVTYRPDEFALTPYRGDWIELKVVIPYVWIRSPVYTVSGLSHRTNQGLGNVITQLSYLFAPPANTWLPFIEAAAKVKIPTANQDKYLGTGKTDVALELTLSKRFGNFTPFGSFGYRWMGDPPGVDLDDRWLASAGVSYRIDRRWSVGLLYDWRQTAISWFEDAHELMPYTSIRLGPRLRLQPYGIIGLADGSPDWGVGLQIRTSISLR
jgi:hypothetical protein